MYQSNFSQTEYYIIRFSILITHNVELYALNDLYKLKKIKSHQIIKSTSILRQLSSDRDL